MTGERSAPREEMFLQEVSEAELEYARRPRGNARCLSLVEYLPCPNNLSKDHFWAEDRPCW